MNRIAWLIAVGYVALAVVSVGIYAAATMKFVDYSQTRIAYSPGGLANGTFTRTPQGWSITLTWRFENPGRLPITIAIFVVQFAVDNRSDTNRSWDDPAKIATEYTGYLSISEDRFTGPVVAAGAARDRGWRFNVTSPEAIAKIDWAANGGFHVGILGGYMYYYIADVDTRFLDSVPSAYVGV